MRRFPFFAAAVIVSTTSGCGSPLPTSPSPGARLILTCSSQTILAGDFAVCMVTADSVNVSPETVWTSSDPDTVQSQGAGLFLGKSEGQATLTAKYSGQIVSTSLTVHLKDVLRATASAYTGSFKSGTTATMWLLGFYGVASANSGTLTLVIMDQDGATISTSAPLTVPHGGDRYNISATFRLSPGISRVCDKGVLQIGATTLTVVPDASLVPCMDVMP